MELPKLSKEVIEEIRKKYGSDDSIDEEDDEELGSDEEIDEELTEEELEMIHGKEKRKDKYHLIKFYEPVRTLHE